MNRTQRRALVYGECIVDYCDMPKGISCAKAVEKIKPVALASIKLHLPEGIRYSVSQ